MRKLIPWLILTLMIASILVPVGIGYAKGNPYSNLVVKAGELKVWPDWSINPCRYEYQHNGTEQVKVTLANLSNQVTDFDMGDGNIATIPANFSRDYTYRVLLKGQTERIYITKIAEGSGLVFQEAIALKIEPIEKGGDSR